MPNNETAQYRRRSGPAAVLLLLLLSGCDTNLQGAGQAADSMRVSAERSAYRTSIASAAREARILDEAVEINRQTAEDDPQDTLQTPRYEARRDGAGWAIYDATTGRPVRSSSGAQTGLTQSRAEQLAYDLQQQDSENRIRSAAFGLGPRPER